MNYVARQGISGCRPTLLQELLMFISWTMNQIPLVSTLEEALKIFSNIGERYKIAMVHLDLGRLHLLMKEYNQMIEDLDLSLAILDELKLPFYYTKVKTEIVSMLKSKGRFKDAKRYSS